MTIPSFSLGDILKIYHNTINDEYNLNFRATPSPKKQEYDLDGTCERVEPKQLESK